MRWSVSLLLAAALACLLLQLASTTKIYDILAQIRATEALTHITAEVDKMPDSVEVEWTSGGATIRVICVKQTGETDAEWASRARAEVQAMKAEFPPDTVQGG